MENGKGLILFFAPREFCADKQEDALIKDIRGGEARLRLRA